ncbi:TaqI-like C-terminal specificity domain-containing protein [Paenibacillus sp. CGMCC 1.18879]|uniref:TaqI-like C-terminal specificity domain-containing protein n=1 Tax=Paenibacillus sp. CGMCC 1.18879 TaxID=2834466 RepID=UPI001CA8F63A|nr:TaqI-like C-terminal specificity domain-containing protein [Paenibacillus sp. CGMCC 1.18879]MBY9078945.1 N-6 DNA methylase [Paenibacillus sp. CGMCC 1.18879]
MSIGEYSNKSMLGSFYTPTHLAKYAAQVLIRQVLKNWENDYINDVIDRDESKDIYLLKRLLEWTVLDPACGDGSLLISVEEEINKQIDHLLRKIGIKGYYSNRSDEVTYGIDIDLEAINVANKNIKSIKNLNHEYTRKAKIVHKDFLVPFKGIKDLKGWSKLFPKIMKENKFSALIANPPWGAKVNHPREELYDNYGYTLAAGQYDSYELFIERSLDLVKGGGPLVFIVPDSIFLTEHKPLRSMLLKRTQIIQISRLGEGFFPGVSRGCVVLLLLNKKPEIGSQTNVFRLNQEWRDRIFSGKRTIDQAQSELTHTIPQRRFLDDIENRFDIDAKDEDMELLRKMEKGNLVWSEVMDSGRGVELSKKGIIIKCSNCKLWQPIPRKIENTVQCSHCGTQYSYTASNTYCIVSNSVDGKDGKWIPFLAGEDVRRYEIETNRYIKLGYEGINYKSPDLFSKEKILIRKTGIGINAALDTEGYTTSQTVFHFNIKEQKKSNWLTHEYLLGVLNSRVMLYYYLKKFGETEWRSHPYITQKIISQLPIPEVCKDERNKKYALLISSLVKAKTARKEDESIDLEIEKLVAGLFGLTTNDCIRVLQTIDEAQQLRLISKLKITNRDVFYPIIIMP